MMMTPTVRRSLLSHLSQIGALMLGAAVVLTACGGDDDATPSDTGGGGKNAGGSAGTSGGGKGGTSQGGSAGNGTGGTIPVAGNSGNPGGASGANAGGANAGGTDAAGAAGDTNGGSAGVGSACQGDPPAVEKKCKAKTDNECDPAIANQAGYMPEGTTGNGFDDDCDGFVDEGCSCSAAGTTKDCYAFPSSQTTGAPNWTPLGVCADPNSGSKGKLTCTTVGSGEFARNEYDGNCSAKPPAAQDSCDTSQDLNCDGTKGNAPDKCKCNPIICPAPIFTTPFPDPNNVGKFAPAPVGPTDPKPIDGIDGKTWFSGNAAISATAKNWRWTITGGTCDDTLPNPTFAAFPTPSAQNWGDAATGHLGTKSLLLPQSPAEKQPDPESPAGTHHGWVVKDGPSKIYPAFSLSGTYYVTGKFTYNDPNNNNQETEGQCTQIVRVRAPGLRVELCWPEVGHNGGDTAQTAVLDNDVDLHVARLQGGTPEINPITNQPKPHGWFTTPGVAPNADDCYYSPNARCGNRTDGPALPNGQMTPGWYPNEITDEPGGVGVCHGWGSRRFGTRPCTSPRLDRDNISCDRTIENPNAEEKDQQQQGANFNNFCGPENINIDGQVLTPGQRFAVGVQCYNCVGGTNANRTYAAHPRVNVYCNGDLKTNFGFNPDSTDPNQYPQLITEGQSANGAFWNVATIEWKGGEGEEACAATPINSGANYAIDAWHDTANGSATYCVNNGGLNKDGNNQTPATNAPLNNWPFMPDGSYPPSDNPNALCSYY